jgi:O-antigen/teichoic acid export membrane protein
VTPRNSSRDGSLRAFRSRLNRQLESAQPAWRDYVKASAASIGLRALALASKLVFLVCVGKYLPIEQMAVYALMTTTVGIAVTLLGLEFYAFSTRELLARDGGEQAVCLRDQFVLHLIAYATLLPLSYPVFATGVIAWSLAGWFLVLAVCEHLSEESMRIFRALLRPVFSTALFFLRSSAWCIVAVALFLTNPGWVTMPLIFGLWAASALISLVLVGSALRKLDWSRVRQVGINWLWIRRGVLVAFPFMLSAAAYRIIELIDRYLIHFMLSDAAVGVYSFYGTIANVTPALIGAAVSTIFTPRVVRAFQAGNGVAYRQYYRTLTTVTVAIVVVSTPIVFGLVAHLQPFLNRPEYAAELTTCAVLLLSTGVNSVAQLPGVALYARKDDFALLVAVLIGAGVNTTLNVVMIPRLGILGAAWATALSYCAMGGYQSYRIWRQPTRFGSVSIHGTS